MDQLEEHERQRCEVWSRVMGYCRPVAAWNIGKRQEHADRKPFTEQRAREAGLIGSHNDRDIRDTLRCEALGVE